MGILNSVQGLGSATAAIVGGHIVIEGANGKILRYEQVGYLAIVLTLLTIIIAYYIYHKIAKTRIHNENIVGAQFHPEKSHKFGMKFYANFLEI